MSEDIRIYSDLSDISFNSDTNLTVDMSIFGETNIIDELNINNFEQNNPNDFLLFNLRDISK